jgi:clan AA aspartic protease
MGEVRVHVRLLNVGDVLGARDGKLDPSQVRSVVAEAVVDTGSVRTVLPRDIAQQLGLKTRAQVWAEYADGRSELVDVTDPIYVEFEGRKESDDPIVTGNEVMIGQTILEKLDLFVDCTRQRLVPNPAHPDQAVNKVK